MAALHGRPCDLLAGHVLHMRYSVPVKPKARPGAGGSVLVALAASELGIPGIYMVREFGTAAEQQISQLSAMGDRRETRPAFSDISNIVGRKRAEEISMSMAIDTVEAWTGQRRFNTWVF